jgi:hypothetical protein
MHLCTEPIEFFEEIDLQASRKSIIVHEYSEEISFPPAYDVVDYFEARVCRKVNFDPVSRTSGVARRKENEVRPSKENYDHSRNAAKRTSRNYRNNYGRYEVRGMAGR